MRILQTIQERFESALQGLAADPRSHAQRVAVSQALQADYQANLAMSLAKELQKDPLAIAHQICDRLDSADLFEAVGVAGKGFINLRLSNEWVCKQLQKMGSDPRLGLSDLKEPKTYVIDYSSPNVAKPMHVGHIRSTVIGDAIAKTLRFVGHKVISDNHLGDWGTQFGMIIYGYKHFRDQAAFTESPVTELGRLYRLVQQLIAYQNAASKIEGKRTELTTKQGFLATAVEAAEKAPSDKKLAKNAKSIENGIKALADEIKGMEGRILAVDASPVLKKFAEGHPNLEQRVLQETAKLHSGDLENNQLWSDFLPSCLEEIHRVYRRLNIQFDYELGESYYHGMLADVVDKLVEAGLAVESDGATCVFLDGFDAPMIIRKQDGAFLYSTTDIATVHYRMENFHPDAILYVVDHRQGDHFQKLFAALKKTGLPPIELKHVAFGTVLGEDGKPFKTRDGDTVGLDSLLNEAVERALEVVKELDFEEAEKNKIAEVVGLGAIKYADLMHSRDSDYVFDMKKMVRLDGNTAPYIQYSYARTQGILRKGEIAPSLEWFQTLPIQISHPSERDLAIHLLKFEDTLLQSLDEYYPSVLAAYVYDLAKLFASFFENCQVLREPDPSLKQSRLGFVYLVGRTLQTSLNLLGIETVERM